MAGIAVIRKAQAYMEELLRCEECGKLRTERVTEWRDRGNGRNGESVATALRFQQRTDATHCTCGEAKATTRCDVCPAPAVALCANNRDGLGGNPAYGSFRSFRCAEHTPPDGSVKVERLVSQ